MHQPDPQRRVIEQKTDQWHNRDTRALKLSAIVRVPSRSSLLGNNAAITIYPRAGVGGE